MNFSKFLIQLTKYRRFHYPNLNLRLDLQKQKTNCLVIVTMIKLSNWTDKFDYRAGSKRTWLASFASKRLYITVINSFSQKLSTWVIAKSNIFTRIDFCCLQVWHFWEQLRCVALSPQIMGITIALLFSLETCFVEIQSVLVNLPVQKDVSFSGQKQLSMSAMRVCVPGAQ